MAEARKTRSGNIKLDSGNIRYNDYMRTLLAEGMRIGAIKQSDCEKLSAALTEILREILCEYIKSGTVSAGSSEDAPELLRSLIFIIDTYLISLGDHSAALKKLRSVSTDNMRMMRTEGIKALRVLQCEALSICAKIRTHLTQNTDTLYADTIEECHNDILGYDSSFLPLAIGDEPKYPTAVHFSFIGGIKYLRRYMLCLSYENDFICSYGENTFENIAALITGGDKQSTPKPAINVYRYALVSATISACLGRENIIPVLTYNDCIEFRKLSQTMSDTQLSEWLENAAGKLPHGNREYNLYVIRSIMQELLSAIHSDSFKAIAAVTDSKEENAG